MRLETFFEKFELFADAPNAIAKMRELVVDLAVRGKLVPNNPEERPVRLNMSADSGNSSIPPNWRSGVLGDAITLEYGDNLPAGKRSGSGEYPVYGSNGIVGTHDSFLTKEPAIIVGRKGSAGALNIANGPSWTTDVAYFVRPPTDLDLRFTYYLLSSLHLDELGKGIKPGLSRKEAYVLPISLPPLAEQKRIVAKVDELMALCDRLEAQQQERDTRHAALARASLSRFAEAPTPANLNFLFHKSYTITPADLRKSILALAVQGKLSKGIETKPVVLGEVIELISGQHLLAHEHNDEGRGIPYLTGPSDFGVRHPKPTRWTETPKVVAEPGDILITVKGSGVGKTNKLVAERTAISRQLMAVRVTEANPDFVHLVLMNAADHFQSSMTGIAIPGIGRRDVLELEAELPPLAEQRRIVAKVDQLMTLVDQLEAQLVASSSTAEKLMQAVVAELTTPN